MKVLASLALVLATTAYVSADKCECGDEDCEFPINIVNDDTDRCLSTEEKVVVHGPGKVCSETNIIMKPCEGDEEEHNWVVSGNDVTTILKDKEGDDVVACLGLTEDMKPALVYCDSDDKVQFDCDDGDIEDKDDKPICFDTPLSKGKNLPTFKHCPVTPTTKPDCDETSADDLECEDGYKPFLDKSGVCPEWDCRRECDSKPECEEDEELVPHNANLCTKYECENICKDIADIEKPECDGKHHSLSVVKDARGCDSHKCNHNCPTKFDECVEGKNFEEEFKEDGCDMKKCTTCPPVATPVCNKTNWKLEDKEQANKCPAKECKLTCPADEVKCAEGFTKETNKVDDCDKSECVLDTCTYLDLC